MKSIKAFTVFLFSLILLVPLAAFNFCPHTSSAIDNRMLAENPFSQETLESSTDLTQNIENYVNDRIGFRDEMILGYTVLNDQVFGKMVHPSYTYGKDGYVFGSGLTTAENSYSDFHETFADLVKQIQDYCTERDIPFLFVFNPAKPAVLSDYLPDGIQYDRTWVDQFFDALDERGVRYVDNTQTLREKTEQGETVFNRKYDANHWNDLGAYYGTNAILQELAKDFSSIQLNDIEDFTVSETLQTSLPVSQFPIYEMVPSIQIDRSAITEQTSLFKDELKMNASYHTFGYYINQQKTEAGAPKALVFQGSYMNNFGYKYLANAFGEYIHIHDYQNILDFPYYYSIFKPDCVIFEVAEYTFSSTYFSYEGMTQLQMNPPVSSLLASGKASTEQTLENDSISVEVGDQLTQIHWIPDASYEYVWLSLEGEEYDMQKNDLGYTATILTETYHANQSLEVTAFDGETLTVYK